MADAVASGPDEEAPDASTQDDAPADGTVEDHPGWVDNRKLKAIQAVKKQIEKSRTFLVEDWTTSTQTVPSATDPDGLNPTVVTGGAGPDSFRTALDEETWNSDTAVEYQSRINSAIDSITAVPAPRRTRSLTPARRSRPTATRPTGDSTRSVSRPSEKGRRRPLEQHADRQEEYVFHHIQSRPR